MKKRIGKIFLIAVSIFMIAIIVNFAYAQETERCNYCRSYSLVQPSESDSLSSRISESESYLNNPPSDILFMSGDCSRSLCICRYLSDLSGKEYIPNYHYNPSVNIDDEVSFSSKDDRCMEKCGLDKVEKAWNDWKKSSEKKSLITGRAVETTGQASNENFIVTAPNQEIADLALSFAECYKKEIEMEWFGKINTAPIQNKIEIKIDNEDSLAYARPINSGGSDIFVQADFESAIGHHLKHEVNHNVFARAFPGQKKNSAFPVWIEEGIGTAYYGCLSQQKYVRIIIYGYASRVKDISAEEMYEIFNSIVFDGNDARAYAVSNSIVNYLVSLKGKKELIDFGLDSKRIGIDSALFRHYNIRSVRDLRFKWLMWLRDYNNIFFEESFTNLRRKTFVNTIKTEIGQEIRVPLNFPNPDKNNYMWFRIFFVFNDKDFKSVRSDEKEMTWERSLIGIIVKPEETLKLNLNALAKKSGQNMIGIYYEKGPVVFDNSIKQWKRTPKTEEGMLLLKINVAEKKPLLRRDDKLSSNGECIEAREDNKKPEIKSIDFSNEYLRYSEWKLAGEKFSELKRGPLIANVHLSLERNALRKMLENKEMSLADFRKKITISPLEFRWTFNLPTLNSELKDIFTRKSETFRDAVDGKYKPEISSDRHSQSSPEVLNHNRNYLFKITNEDIEVLKKLLDKMFANNPDNRLSSRGEIIMALEPCGLSIKVTDNNRILFDSRDSRQKLVGREREVVEKYLLNDLFLKDEGVFGFMNPLKSNTPDCLADKLYNVFYDSNGRIKPGNLY